MLLMLLGGCASAQTPEATPAPIALPTVTPELQPAAGGELVMPIPRNPFKGEGGVSANPLLVNTQEMRDLYLLVYEPLLRADQNNRITASLAEKWSADETGRVWTIQLRQNVRWHEDGALLTAADVKYTIDMIGTLGADSYYSFVKDVVEQAEVVDEKTLRITMKNSGASSLYALSFPVLSAQSSPDALNGTGPYKVQGYTESSVDLVVNEQWWRQLPYIQHIRGLSRDSNSVALDSYEAGQLNFVPTATVSAGKYREEGHTNVLDIMTQDAEMILLNHQNATLSNPLVRQAIAYGIDRSALVSNVYMNRAAISDVPVPPDSFLYDPTSNIYDYDPAKAEALLAEAGWNEKNSDGILLKEGRPLHLKLLVNDSTESTYRKNAAALIASQLLQVGIEIEVETKKLSVGEADGEFEQALQAGDFQLAMAGFQVPRNGDISQYVKTDGIRNYGHYSNAEISGLVDQAEKAIEEKDMRDAHAKLQQAVAKELPFIMLYFRKSSIVYSAEINNVGDIRESDVMRTVHRWYMEEQA